MKIKELRESKGLTQEALADKLGTKRSTVAMWETGKALPRAEMLKALSAELDCTIDDLLAC